MLNQIDDGSRGLGAFYARVVICLSLTMSSHDVPITLLAALADNKLFASHFRGSSWNGWKAFLAALTSEPMGDGAFELYKRCTGRQEPPIAAFSEACLVVGRRGGKSRVLALIATYLATFKDYSPYLAPGEVATVGVLAANRAQARSIFRFVSGLLKAVPQLASMVEDETGEIITLNSRVVIEINTASFRTTRGYSYAAVLCDEIAFWRSDETSANPDTEILRALRPGMASIPGSILLLASSPYAKKGELYNTYRKHYGKEQPPRDAVDTAGRPVTDGRVLVWKADTSTMNPGIDPAIIAEAYGDDPESAKAEYGAEFRDDLADWVTRESVDAVTMWGCRERMPEDDIQYAAFADPSGGANDAFTLAVAHLRDGSVGVLDAVLEIRPPFDPDVAVRECAALLERFKVKRVIGDRYAGEWPVSRFAAHGITFEQSAKPKSDIYHDMLPLLNSRRVELLEHQRLTAQLCGLERKTSRAGRDSIDHAPGGHDDIANAVCGVLVGLELDRRPALIRASSLYGADDGAIAVPKVASLLYAVFVVARDGTAAAAFFAAYVDHDPAIPPLTLLDYSVAPLSSATIDSVYERMAELAGGICILERCTAVYVPEVLLQQVHLRGRGADVIPEEVMADPEGLALSVAGHINSGLVKMARPAAERSQTSPLRGALAYKAGEEPDADPLRWAILVGIGLGLTDQRSFVAPVVEMVG